ncbi:MAG: hypothetical protein R3C15_20525 [Thermoleophilia bacterium]
MSIAAPTPDVRARAWRASLVALDPPRALALVVALTAFVRVVASWARTTPVYFPDEYLYSELGRSLVESGEPLVRGTRTSFPSLLHPILTAPAWLLDDVEAAFRLIQSLGAVAMALAAVPAFLLARRAGVGAWPSVAVAALAVAVPDLLLSSWIVAEPFAYPLLLGALWAGVASIVDPRRRYQLAFVALAALALLARAQLALVPIAFLAALLATGLRERRLRAALREQGLVLALVGLPVALGAALLVSGRLGPYSGALSVGLEPLGAARWSATNALVLAYAAGWAIVPGALVGAWLALARPAGRGEAAFGAAAITFGLGTLVQAGLVSSSLTGHVHERYVFPLVPLLAIAFCLWLGREAPGRLAVGLLAAGLLAVSALVPLSGLAAAQGKADSPVLRAFAELERIAGTSGDAALLVAAAAAVLSLVAAAGALRRTAAPLALASSLVVCLAASGAAIAYDAVNAARVRDGLPLDPSWVDAAAREPVTLLWTPGGDPADAHELLFWNRRVDRALLLPDALPFDPYAADGVVVDADGSLSMRGRVVDGPLVVEDRATTVVLAGARPVAASEAQTLWLPTGPEPPRLALQLTGRARDGWLSPLADLTVWPTDGGPVLAARLVLDVQAPPGERAVELEIVPDRGRPLVARVAPGAVGRVTATICVRGPWHANVRATPASAVGSRAVALLAEVPRLVPDPTACAGRVPLEPDPAPGPTAATV